MKNFLLLCLITQIVYAQPKINFQPEFYNCPQISIPLSIDGRLDEPAWKTAAWTNDFRDIVGNLKPMPPLQTHAKMLWDAEYFYIAAQLEEPHVWAKLMQRDTVIFYDNDFEIFIDPDGDTYNYYELEMNAFNTVWDLYLDKPYRNNGTALFYWDIRGLQTGVSVQGSLNNAADIDSRWTVEIAIPWTVLAEAAHQPAPPLSGDVWRVNFSRVEWQTEIIDDKYVKKINPQTGKPFPEDNWVWSPQGLVNMHYPEMWGFVRFCDDKMNTQELSHPALSADEQAKWQLRQIYYAEKNHFATAHSYTSALAALNLVDLPKTMQIEATRQLFQAEIYLEETQTTWAINQDGLVWPTRKQRK